MTEKYYSVVIPVYNSAGSLRQLASRLVTFFTGKGLLFELIFIDDRSTDNSWELIREIVNGSFYSRGIRLEKNYGQLAATTCGIYQSKGEFIITIDDDLQFAPEEMEKFFSAVEKFPGALLILGNPVKKKQKGMRKFFSKLVQFALRYILMPSYHSKNLFTSFRMINRKLLHQSQERGLFNIFYLWEINARLIHCIPVEHGYRIDGRTNYSMISLVKAMTPVIYFSLTRIFYFIAAIIFIIGVFLYNSSVNKFLFPVIAIFCFISAIFFGKKLRQKRNIYYKIDEII